MSYGELENEEIEMLISPEFAGSPDILDGVIFPRDLSAFESAEAVLWVIGNFVVVSCVFSFASDCMAQHVQGRRFCVGKPPCPPPPPGGPGIGPGDGGKRPLPYDWKRSFQFMGTGTIFVGGAQFIRLGLIRTMYDPNDRSLRTVLEKVALNQFILSPVVNCGAMFTLVYCQYRDCAYAWEKVKDDFCEAQMVAYTVKPLGNFIAFFCFPGNLMGQLLVTRTVALAYNTFFSVLVHRDLQGEHVVEWVKEKGWKEGEEEGDEEWYWETETHKAQWTDPRDDKHHDFHTGERTPSPRNTDRSESPRAHDIRVSTACGCSIM
eukprot:TRINITY_DN786_c0_g2_i1.p2 TRINITY_DN786_c0_g2~~TRINITY_DN786_c0_g2_i1.p2  ORF type:complete len:320 (+),score=101.39 TRINITY_DN786_c0_g2_i1:187-1146(+)